MIRSLFPRPGEPGSDPESASKGTIGSGVGLAVICQACCLFAALPASIFELQFGIILLATWGGLQWLALIPAVVIQIRSGYALTAKGILIAGAVGFLLNGACDALVFPIRLGP